MEMGWIIIRPRATLAASVCWRGSSLPVVGFCQEEGIALWTCPTWRLKRTGFETYGLALGKIALWIFRVLFISRGFPCKSNS